ncbi:hypothetical protein OQA88_5295 [Cercophora sp. LCS_1]
MDIDSYPRKRLLEEDALELHVAKKTRQADAPVHALALGLESPPSTPGASEAPSPAALQQEDNAMQIDRSPSPSQPGSITQSRRYQRYLQQGYPASWLRTLN